MLWNYWHVGCASSQLGNKPKAIRIGDTGIAIYRDSVGRACALLDRCCHRGVKLSDGHVAPTGHIACAYHGWQYDMEGRCVHIPSLTEGRKIPVKCKTQSFPVVEQDSYVWIWMGDGNPIPEIPPVIPDFEKHAWHQGVTLYNCNARMLIENQFDTCHPMFTHPKSHPSWFFAKANKSKDHSYETRITESGFVTFTPPAKVGSDPIPPDNMGVTRFELPGRVLLKQKSIFSDFQIVLHVVQVTDTTSRLEWLQKVKGEKHNVQWIEQEPLINAQDRFVLESAQLNYSNGGDDFEQSVEVDHVTLLLRKIVALAGAGEWEGVRNTLQQRRVINFRY
jgi:phenylpropionate dioxygenase-like ring-hydroxylating dioxygenase large terminal subunit